MAIPDRQELFDYYNERAPEYEDAYWGKFFMEVPDPAIYRNDTQSIQELLPDNIHGKCLDLACGTGFWLPVYERNCTGITLIDQSEGVLAECDRKIQNLGINKKTEVIKDDLFSYNYRQHFYDSIMLGFLISHLAGPELDGLITITKKALKASGKLAIIDNLWDDARVQLRNNKAGIIKRYLKDGREFEIYKRYFDQADLGTFADKYGLELNIAYWGKVFFLAIATFKEP